MPQLPPPPSGPALQFKGRMDYPETEPLDHWGLTPEQQMTYVEQFRRHLEQLSAYDPEKHDFYMLRRFLRARSYNMEKATAMWQASLEWRREHEVDDILMTFEFPERDEVLKIMPQGYHKTDKTGRPVYIYHFGALDWDACKKVSTGPRVLRFTIYEYERLRKVVLPVCSRLAGRNIDQTLGIVDLKGASLSKLTAEFRKVWMLSARWSQDNFPEMMGKVIVINAPSFFMVGWAVCKLVLDARTLTKFEIYGKDYKQALLQEVEAANLPAYLGGTSGGALEDDIGPWSDPKVIARLGIDLRELRAKGFCGVVPAAAGGAVNGVGGAEEEEEEEEEREAAAAVQTGAIRVRTSDGGGSDVFFDAVSEAGSAHTQYASCSAGSSPALPSSLVATPLGTPGGAMLAAAAATPGSAPRSAARPAAAQTPSASVRVYNPDTDLAPAAAASSHRSTPTGSAPLPSAADEAAGATATLLPHAGGQRGSGASSLQNLSSPKPVPPLAERIRKMDQILREHAGQGRTPLTQSLVPPPPFNGAAARSTALEGTLAYRVELLEEGLDLLLRAQELSWQEKKAAAAASGGAAAAQEASNSDNSRGCCCTVM